MFLNEYILHHLYVIVYSENLYLRVTINTSFANIYKTVIISSENRQNNIKYAM